MFDKSIIEALMFYGPLNASEMTEKLALREINLSEAFVANRLRKMMLDKKIKLAYVLGADEADKYSAFYRI